MNPALIGIAAGSVLSGALFGLSYSASLPTGYWTSQQAMLPISQAVNEANMRATQRLQNEFDWDDFNREQEQKRLARGVATDTDLSALDYQYAIGRSRYSITNQFMADLMLIYAREYAKRQGGSS